MQMLPLLEEAAANVMREMAPREEDGSEPPLRDVQVSLTSSTGFGPGSLRHLTAECVTRLVMVPGIVTHAQCPLHKAASLTLQCRDCKELQIAPLRPGANRCGPAGRARGLSHSHAAPSQRWTRCHVGARICVLSSTVTPTHSLPALSIHIPRRCPTPGGTCSLDPFLVLPHLSKFVDSQKLKLQERPEDVPTGELPRSW